MDMVCVFPFLQESGVTLSLLKDITDEELKEVIPKLGVRMEFKRALCSWNQRNNCEKPSISNDHKEDHEKNFVLNKSIRSLLSKNEHGKALLNKNTLLEVDRIWLINTIVEEAINNYLCIINFK
ncbi:uncharacterized protein LOC122625790 [Drosophila teissieri]|uniref:uncharacterized protein LOC122625790 n=1 Tax=Drosophila teissieri TaxID=7243 RepID=UPI001CBA5C37|nr:uncharacterized protein LOC122625790 [Drosophila teissieri]